MTSLSSLWIHSMMVIPSWSRSAGRHTHIPLYVFDSISFVVFGLCVCRKYYQSWKFILYFCVCVFTVCKSSLLVRSLQFMKLITLIYFFSLSQSNCYHLIIVFFDILLHPNSTSQYLINQISWQLTLWSQTI